MLERDVLVVGAGPAGLAASIFHFGEVSISDLKKEMKKNSIPTRIQEKQE